MRIRLPIPYAFGLIARLYPVVSAFKVLKTAEGIELLPSVYFSVACVLCLLLHARTLDAALIGAVVYGTMSWFGYAGVFFPGEIAIGTLYSCVAIWGIPEAILIGSALFFAGWKMAVAFVIARIVGQLLYFLVAIIQGRELKRRRGLALPPPEMSFLYAYQVHAARLGLTTDVTLSENEKDEKHWGPPLYDLAAHWPKVVARFTPG